MIAEQGQQNDLTWSKDVSGETYVWSLMDKCKLSSSSLSNVSVQFEAGHNKRVNKLLSDRFFV